MKLLKSIVITGVLLTSIANYGQFTDQINSNRSGKSMGAFAVGKKVYQVESGLYYINESHDVRNYDARGFGLEFDARGGFIKEQLEFILEAQFQLDKYSVADSINTSRSGLKQTTFGAKYLFYDPFKKGPAKPNIYSWKANHRMSWKQFIPAISGYVGVNYVMKNDYSIPDESVISPKVMLITQHHFGMKWVLVSNIIADKITSNNSSFGSIFTLTRGINEKWSAFIENKAVKGNYYSDGIFTIGATHLLKNNIQVDASISKNIKSTPSLLYGGIGFSWRFDKKHKDIQIKDGKEVKEKKEDKDKKSKGSKTQEELDKEKAKAEKKARKNRPDGEEEPAPETKKKRLDDLEEETPTPTP
ncbi:transporter [Flavobacterium sp.]|uniref:transporter n=1 Tax=Flavobacterium sp. TaxID=239 RepID=UPI003751261B